MPEVPGRAEKKIQDGGDRMISLEMARKLKDAGLEWEPKINDFFKGPYGIDVVFVLEVNIDSVLSVNGKEFADTVYIWLPRLDQLLAEIEKCAYEWCLEQARDKYRLSLWFDQACVYEFRASTPEDAAAQALLWILEGR